MSDKSGFVVHYRSARALRRDHETAISKGGMLIAWRSPPPDENSQILVRIESPDGTLFDLPARVGSPMHGRGFTVNFEVEPGQRGRMPIDLFMRGDRMKRLVDAERPGSAPSEPEVRAFGELAEVLGNEEMTDPTMSHATHASPAPAHGAGEDVIDAPTFAESATDADQAGNVDMTEAADAEVAIEEIMPEGFRMPQPGEEYLVYVIKYAQVTDFGAVRDDLRKTQRLHVNYPEEPSIAGKIAQLRLTLPGHNVFQMFGAIEKAGPHGVTLVFDENNDKFRLACNYIDTPPARNRMKNEESMPKGQTMVVRLTEKVPEEDPEKMPIRRRLQRMGMDDKINMALSGGREERMALAMDGNKAVHHYLLRNAKISLDEIAFMARLPTMNPDVLDKIAENTSYTQNPSVVKALVYNPKTPVPTAIRLLDRLPRPEVMNLAKRTNMNLRLVMAAKKKLEGRRK